MRIDVCLQGEIIHLLTPDGFIQIYIQSINPLTGQVSLGVIAPFNVKIVSCDSDTLGSFNGNGLGRLDIMRLLHLEEVS